jgi:ketosteroid isomerase-like protein
MDQLTVEQVRSLFSCLERGDSDSFFSHVADTVHWTVMGTHPLAGTYHDKKTFIQSTFHRLNRVLRDGVRLRVTHVLVSRDTAAVELEALSTAVNGRPFANKYCWICRFSGDVIVEVRAYLDSALVRQVLEENEELAESSDRGILPG